MEPHVINLDVWPVCAQVSEGGFDCQYEHIGQVEGALLCLESTANCPIFREYGTLRSLDVLSERNADMGIMLSGEL